MTDQAFHDSRPVLVVQDCNSIAQRTKNTLEKVGYTNVQIVKSNRAAREYLERLGTPAFAVIADLMITSDSEENILLQIKDNTEKYGTPHRALCSGVFQGERGDFPGFYLEKYQVERVSSGDELMILASWLLQCSARDLDPCIAKPDVPNSINSLSRGR